MPDGISSAESPAPPRDQVSLSSAEPPSPLPENGYWGEFARRFLPDQLAQYPEEPEPKHFD